MRTVCFRCIFFVVLLFSVHIKAEQSSDLYKAIKANKKKRVASIIADSPDALNKKIQYYSYPLLEALKLGKGEIAIYLLELGADADVKDKNLGGTAMDIFAANSYRMNFPIFKTILEKLVQKGADINAVNSKGKTPLETILSFAVTEKNVSVLKQKISFMLEKGAEINPSDKEAVPTLFAFFDGVARLKSGHAQYAIDILSFLIDKGADVNAVNENSDTVLMKLFSVTPNHLSSSDRIRMADILFDKGADVNAVNSDKNTVLHILLKDSYKKFGLNEKIILAEYLIENGAKTTLKNKKHESPKSLSKKNKKLHKIVISTRKKKRK
jgi:ankyrin repeat protein